MINVKKIKSEKPIEELIKFGLINIDKPAGPTSFSISDYVRKALNLNKTSHAGTLDPQVTGVLPIMLGRACRLSDYFMHRDKTYVGIMRLHEDVDENKLKETISEFIGKISQMPPVRSRVKRALREREIKSFDISEREGKDILFSTQVQAGTYIRKLCDDMGKKIGGAHMLELRRTKAGIFEENSKDFPLTNLYDFDKAVEEYKAGNDKPLRKIIVPAEIISTLLPVFQLKEEFKQLVLRGSPIHKGYLESEKEIKDLNEGDNICLFIGDNFIGIYTIALSGNILAKPEFVFN